MANLYEINSKLMTIFEDGFDIETGEILEGYDLEKALNDCELELIEKVDNIASFIKSLKAEAEAIKTEKQKLDQRMKIKNNKADRLMNYLDNYFKQTSDVTKFKKIETPRNVISYRKSESIVIDDLNKIPTEFIRDRVIKENDVDKTKIKNFLKTDSENVIEGVHLQENRNLSIK